MRKSLAVAAALMLAPVFSASANVIPGAWTVITWTAPDGVLRDGSPWGPGSTPSSALFPVDGLFQPEQTQWNNGSFWWDQDPSVSQTEMIWTVYLNQSYALNRLLMQADNNDTYVVETWTGASWVSVFDVPAVSGFGLMTRDSGIIPSFTTDRLRFRATGGDLYYSVSELQAFAVVPEPATWAMMIAGFGLVGFAMRRRRPAAA